MPKVVNSNHQDSLKRISINLFMYEKEVMLFKSICTALGKPYSEVVSDFIRKFNKEHVSGYLDQVTSFLE